MPNHFHFLIKANSKTVASVPHPNPLIKNTMFSKELGKMLSSYTRALQKQEGFTGSLFQQKTKAKQVSGGLVSGDDYAGVCFVYILNNPVRAGLVKAAEDWEFSNYPDLLGLRSGDLCKLKMIREELGLDLTTVKEMLGTQIPVLENPSIF
jgi:REP element-mobilizing transposase RayT